MYNVSVPTLSLSNVPTYSVPPITSQFFNSSFCNDQGYQWVLGPTTDWFPASLSSSCLSSALQRCSSYIAKYSTTSYFPPFNNDCCGNQCLFWAQTAKVIYWPTPAPQSGVTSLVDASGFTFISPSAYVAFASMEAENACGIQGSIIDMTTVAFGQSELSTYAYSPFGEPIRQLNFSDFNGCNPSGEYNSALPYRCQPDLAFESMGYTFQPAWSTCIFRDAPPDPPFALIPGSDLGTIPTAVISVSTPAIAHPITSIPALPINTQTLDTPMPTSQPQTTAGLPQEPDPSSIAIGSISSDSPGVQSVPQQNTIASQLYTADSLSQYTTKGQTDAPKATITTQRSSVSILQATSIALTSATVVFGGQTYTAEVVSALSTIGQPYTPAVVIIMSGTPTTIALPSIIDPHSTPGVLTISAQSYSPDPASNLEHSSQTSPTNTIITFSGTPLTVIVPTLASTGPEVFTFAGSTYTANSASNFIVGSQTLVPGSVITMSGSPITFEVGVSETDVVIGTSTQNLGALIIGPFATPTNSSMVNIGANGPFASSAKRLVIGIDRLIFLTLLLTMGWGGRGFV